MSLGPSELILNADGSIYHLNLLPGDIAPVIITVGDPDRVAQVSRYFDHIEIRKGKREFLTHTGTLNGKCLTVISTGIGTDNIDIVVNELDALANIDFASRSIKKQFTRLDFIRIGTSGAVQPEISVDSFVLSEFAIGLDGLQYSYKGDRKEEHDLIGDFVAQTDWAPQKARPYLTQSDAVLAEIFASNRIRFGGTVTNTGFYGPQGRALRLPISDTVLLSKWTAFEHHGRRIFNMEMETSGMYLLSNLLGHRAVSLSCILANRSTDTFSNNPDNAIDELIRYTLQKLTACTLKPKL